MHTNEVEGTESRLKIQMYDVSSMDTLKQIIDIYKSDMYDE